MTLGWVLALALVPAPPGDLKLVDANCFGGTNTWSCYFDGTIWLAPTQATESVLLHEVGHAYDERVLKPRHRRLFRRWIGADRWRTTGQEMFASAYSLCARQTNVGPNPDTQYGWRPSEGLHDRVCWLIRRAGR